MLGTIVLIFFLNKDPYNLIIIVVPVENKIIRLITIIILKHSRLSTYKSVQKLPYVNHATNKKLQELRIYSIKEYVGKQQFILVSTVCGIQMCSEMFTHTGKQSW